MEEEKTLTFNIKKEVLKNPKWKRSSNTIAILKRKLMKFTSDRKTSSVKIDARINHKIWARGAKNPFTKIKLRIRNIKDGKIKAELV